MARTSWLGTVRIIAVAVVIAAGLLGGTGCSEQAVTPPSASNHLRLWIDDGPDKPATTIRIAVPESMWISLTIRDPEGGQIRTLYEDVIEAGAHSFVWDARDDAGEAVASGPYWTVLTDGGGLMARAMMLIK